MRMIYLHVGPAIFTKEEFIFWLHHFLDNVACQKVGLLKKKLYRIKNWIKLYRLSVDSVSISLYECWYFLFYFFYSDLSEFSAF